MMSNWIVSMQNGSIGEARTKAFLIDRFWILERSVDIDGADFIIQCRDERETLAVERAPRLGLVQAKYFQSENTTQYIPKAYVVDTDNNPRKEFFLIAHTGDEEHPRMFFLSATMIAEDFALKERNNSLCFALPGKKVLGASKYEILNKRNVLNRIENQLEFADLIKNRRFLNNIPYSEVNHTAILTKYKEPIHNWWGNIPDEFKKLKQEIHQSMRMLEKAHGYLKEVADEIDPLKSLSLLENFAHYHCNAGRDWSIKLPDLFDPEFIYACRGHERKMNFLLEKGLLDTFLDLPKKLKTIIAPYLISHSPISVNVVHEVIITFSRKNFDILSLEQSLIPVTEYFNVPEHINRFGHVDIGNLPYSGFKDEVLDSGTIHYFWIEGRHSIDDKFNGDRVSYYSNSLDLRIYLACIEKMYEQLEY